MLATLALFIFPVLMAYAASSDLLTMRIANWLVVLVVLAYLGLALLVHIPWEQIGWAAVAAVAVLVVAFAFFALGWIGGGNVGRHDRDAAVLDLCRRAGWRADADHPRLSPLPDARLAVAAQMGRP